MKRANDLQTVLRGVHVIQKLKGRENPKEAKRRGDRIANAKPGLLKGDGQNPGLRDALQSGCFPGTEPTKAMGRGAEESLEAALEAAVSCAVAGHNCGCDDGWDSFIWEAGPRGRAPGEDGVGSLDLLSRVERISLGASKSAFEMQNKSV